MNSVKLTLIRGRTFFDMLYTWWEFKDIGVSVRSPLSYRERLFYFQLRSCLGGKNLVVYDIGAATGNVTAMLAKLKNVSFVYAFEPIPSVFIQLQSRVRNFSHVRCFNVALGDKNQTATLYQSEATDSSSLLPMSELHRKEYPYTASGIESQVTEVRLDDWVIEKQLLLPDVVKLDVQGFELRVLSNGGNAIRNARYCVLEMAIKPLYEGAPIFNELYEWMRDWGFIFAGFINSSSGLSGQILQVDGVFVREQ